MESIVLATQIQVAGRIFIVALIFGLTGAGTEPAKGPGRSRKGRFDAPTAAAMEQAKTEQAKDDKALSPKALGEKEKKLAKLDAFVQDRAAKNPEDLSVQRTASHYSLQRGDFKVAGARAEQALALATPEGDPKLTAEMLVVRGTAKYQQGDIPGAADGRRAAGEGGPTNRAGGEVAK